MTMNLNKADPNAKRKRSPMAGGIFIFFGLLSGTIIGIAKDQASVGMISGFAIGSAIALLIWLIDSLRKKDI